MPDQNQEPRAGQDTEAALVQATLQRLLATCRAAEWAGHDPYDGLNSRLFAASPLARSKIARLGITQLLKRSPWNVRPLLRVPRTPNPKGLALGLMAAVRLARLGLLKDDNLVTPLVERLAALRSPDTDHWCWGYNFPWQTRTVLVPRHAPNLVCTVFAAQALLDAHAFHPNPGHLRMAIGAADYLLQDLYWTDGHGTAGFGYPLPGARSPVHNANFLGAALLGRVHRLTGETRFAGPAMEVARSAAARQQPDGSWFYGETPRQRWIDNFHTGYNLCALQNIGHDAGTTEFETCLRRGYEFYRSRFFREDGAPKYYHDRAYPLDIHSVAQSLITLVAFAPRDAEAPALARTVFRWAMSRMWDPRGFFYYQVRPWHTVKTSYMRWSQTWMLAALAAYLEAMLHPASLAAHREALPS